MLTVPSKLARAARSVKLSTIGPEILTQGREYGATYLTEFAVVLAQLLTYKLAARQLGTEGFAEYAIARRTISFIYPLALLGLTLALPRYIGYTKGDPNRSSVRYFGAALWCVVCVLALGAGLMTLFQKQFASLFFGSKNYIHLVLPLGLIMAGLMLHSIVYSHFRGHLALKQANLLQFLNLAIVPVIAFSKFGTGVRSLLLALGVLTATVAGIGFLFTPWREALALRSWREAKELLQYGLQRIPGGFALLALLALPATFAVHLRGVQEAGYVAFGTSVLTMSGSAFTPIGLILLPKASQMLANGAQEELRQHVIRILKLTVIVSLGITLGFEVLARTLVRLYLGSDFSSIVIILRILSLGIFPYALFYVLRGLIDAYHIKAVNTFTCAISFAIFLTGCVPALFHPSAAAIPLALLVSLWLLGLLTMREARCILRRTAVCSPIGVMSN